MKGTKIFLGNFFQLEERNREGDYLPLNNISLLFKGGESKLLLHKNLPLPSLSRQLNLNGFVRKRENACGILLSVLWLFAA